MQVSAQEPASPAEPHVAHVLPVKAYLYPHKPPCCLPLVSCALAPASRTPLAACCHVQMLPGMSLSSHVALMHAGVLCHKAAATLKLPHTAVPTAMQPKIAACVSSKFCCLLLSHCQLVLSCQQNLQRYANAPACGAPAANAWRHRFSCWTGLSPLLPRKLLGCSVCLASCMASCSTPLRASAPNSWLCSHRPAKSEFRSFPCKRRPPPLCPLPLPTSPLLTCTTQTPYFPPACAADLVNGQLGSLGGLKVHETVALG